MCAVRANRFPLRHQGVGRRVAEPALFALRATIPLRRSRDWEKPADALAKGSSNGTPILPEAPDVPAGLIADGSSMA